MTIQRFFNGFQRINHSEQHLGTIQCESPEQALNKFAIDNSCDQDEVRIEELTVDSPKWTNIHNGINYYDFPDSINWDKFNWDNYFQSEKYVLQPQLEKLGFTNIRWHDGERDSFGPLTRLCVAHKDNVVYRMVYG